MHYFWLVLSSILILVGLVGVLLPFLPGLPLAFVGAYILAYVTEFDLVSKGTLWFLGGLTLVSLIVDYASGVLGTRFGKASLFGTLGAIIGLLVGFLTLGLFGLILGPALGVLLFELIGKQDRHRAIRVAQTTLVSSCLGMVLNAILALVFALSLILALIF